MVSPPQITGSWFHASASLLLLLWGWGCRHESLAPPDLSPDYVSSPCTVDSSYFVRDVLPVLQSNCAVTGCHDAATQEDGVRLDHYRAVLETGEVEPGRPENSDLYKVCVENSSYKKMPPPPRSLTPAQIEHLRRWIAQGARNNNCN